MSEAAIVNALTVDVEDYFQVSAFAQHLGRSEWSRQESRVVRNTEATLELLASSNVRATFFVLGMVAEEYPTLVRRIAECGHEVACHGYSHKLIYEQTREEFEQETIRAKRLLEDLVGAEIVGYRAASFSITKQSQWALDTLYRAGFQYDSSIVPVRHDRYGIPGASRRLGEIETPDGHRLVEFPPSTARWLGVNVPIAGGGYFRIFPYSVSRFGMNSINSTDSSPFIFYFHPWEIDPEQPRIESSRFSRFRHYTNLDKTYDRLRKLIVDFQFDTAVSVIRRQGYLQ